MTVEEAVAFLENRQPMAPDPLLSKEDLARYKQILELAGANWHGSSPTGPMDPRLIGPLMGALGDGAAAGLHEEADRLLREVDHDLLRPYVLAGLASDHVGHRIWSVRLAEVFEEDAEVMGILRRLAVSDPDEDVRLFAQEVLEAIEEIPRTG